MEEGIGGVTESFKNRIVVPFEESYEKFRHVIAHELVHAYMNDMIYGASVQSVISGAVRLQLPLWYAEGMAEFMSLYWDTRADMILRDGTIHGYLNRISPYQLGQALMKYISDKYGEEKTSDVLRRVNITKDIERGFVSALGIDLEKLSERFELAMKRRYWPDIADRKNPDEFATRLTDHLEDRNYINSGPAISPNGDKLAYISDKSGYQDVYLISAINGEMIGKLLDGQRNPDLEELKFLTPGMSWSPDGDFLALSVKAGDQDALTIVNVNTKKRKQYKFGLDGVYDADWSPSGEEIAFSGTMDGKVDIYAFNVNTEQIRKVTDDYFTDSFPSWSPDGSRLLFVSDRKNYTDDIFVLNKETANGNGSNGGSGVYNDFKMYNHDYSSDDLYMVNADGSRIERLTFEGVNDGSPAWSPDGDKMIYTSEKSGISNIYVMDLETRQSYPITNAITGCYQLSLSKEGSKLVFVSYYQAGYDVYMIKNPFEKEPIEGEIEKTVFFKELDEKAAKQLAGGDIALAERLAQEAAEKPVKKDLSQYIFDERARNYVQEVQRQKSQFDLKEDDIKDTDGSYKVKKYKLKFTPDVVAGNYGYDTFYGVQGSSYLQFSDMLGNHTIMVGTDMYFDLRNSDYQIMYYYLPKKTDYGIGVYNFVDFFTQWGFDPNYGYIGIPIRLRNYGANIMASRPFSKYKRLDFGFSASNVSLEYLDSYYEANNWNVTVYRASASMVVDNTLWGFLGPIDGRRANLSFSASPPIGDKQSRYSFYTLMGDYRKYFRLSREVSFALRLSGGYSEGETPEAFFLGGVPNWINRQFKGDIRTGLQDIFFSHWVSPLRGSQYYELVGNRYFLMNSEIRYPFIRNLTLGWPLPAQFQNLLGAIFWDVGSAWTNNDFKLTETLEDGSQPFRDFRMGFGVGARVYLGGFFLVRLDVAWNYDNVKTSKPIYMVSLGGDW